MILSAIQNKLISMSKEQKRKSTQGECNLWSLKNLQVLLYSKYLHEKNHVITY